MLRLRERQEHRNAAHRIDPRRQPLHAALWSCAMHLCAATASLMVSRFPFRYPRLEQTALSNVAHDLFGPRPCRPCLLSVIRQPIPPCVGRLTIVLFRITGSTYQRSPSSWYSGCGDFHTRPSIRSTRSETPARCGIESTSWHCCHPRRGSARPRSCRRAKGSPEPSTARTSRRTPTRSMGWTGILTRRRGLRVQASRG